MEKLLGPLGDEYHHTDQFGRLRELDIIIAVDLSLLISRRGSCEKLFSNFIRHYHTRTANTGLAQPAANTLCPWTPPNDMKGLLFLYSCNRAGGHSTREVETNWDWY